MEGEMMIVKELMATSLRSQLETDVYFLQNTVKATRIDVACCLNYLHLILPDPMFIEALVVLMSNSTSREIN